MTPSDHTYAPGKEAPLFSAANPAYAAGYNRAREEIAALQAQLVTERALRERLRKVLWETTLFVDHHCRGDLHNKCYRCDVSYKARALLQEASDDKS